ncbi:MAG: hydrogenase maturation protease [Gammaproteobacteria bacterium]|nr:hydrogenase maturation protease [Gammaproteobacteria bacterium]
MTLNPDIRVIGIGSHQGPDATGWIACEMLKAQTTSTRIDWQICRTPAQLPELVGDYNTVVIVDAVLSDKPMGQVFSLLWPIQQETHDSPCSSHGLNVIEALQLASALGQLPMHTYILGITISRQQQDATLVVKNALPLLQQELEKIQKNLASS